MAIKEMICITCPRGCHLSVDTETFAVTGNSCPKGAQYGENELKNPVRVLTSTVKITGAAGTRLPVKTKTAIPKGLIFAAMAQIDAYTAKSPVRVGEELIENIAGSGVPLVACKKM